MAPSCISFQFNYLAPFRKAVDWIDLGLADYPCIVKHPMDLGLVKGKCDERSYESVCDAAQDVHLIWKNCMMYNPEGTEYHMLAEKLSMEFEEVYSSLGTIRRNHEKLEDSHISVIEKMQSPARVMQNQNQKSDYENPVGLRSACPDCMALCKNKSRSCSKCSKGCYHDPWGMIVSPLTNQHDGSGAMNQVRVDTIVTKEEEEKDMPPLTDLTHVVTSGKFESCKGIKICADEKSIWLCLISDECDHKMDQTQTICFRKSQVQELDSYNFIASINTANVEDEDNVWVKYEEQCWECPKCWHYITNDAGLCINIVEGVQCWGTKRCVI